MSITSPFNDFAPLPARRALTWFADGLRLWRRAPFALLLLSLAPLLVEGLLQLIPWIGVIASKFVTPLIGFGVLAGVGELAQGRRLLKASCLLTAWRHDLRRPLAGLALWSMSVFASQLVVAMLVYGTPVLDAVVFLHPSAHPELMTRAFMLILILPGLVLGTLLMLAPPLVLFQGIPPSRAVLLSIRRVVSAPLPFLIVMLLGMALMAFVLGTRWGFLLLLPFLAWMSAVSYVVWRDVVTAPVAERSPALPANG